MPFKITNITRKTFKQPVPLTITFNDGFKTIKHTIEPDDTLVLLFKPKSAQELHIRNMVTIEEVSNDSLIPVKKVVIIPNIIPTTTNNDITLENSDSDNNIEEEDINKKYKKK